jgi:3-polyprenyl-4-hydroxybenzoate decarboxylase/SAM-dependent methyltransferase
VVRIVDHGASTTVIGPEVARRFEGDSAALLRAVLEIHARPVGRAELLAALAVRAATTPAELPVAPIDEIVALLVGDGVLVAAPPLAGTLAAARSSASMLASRLRRVVLGVSGAVAAVDAPELVRGLQSSGCEVRVALTRNAARLVSRAALEAITHHQVWAGLWQRDARAPVPHVNLAEWAELVIVYPASATTLSQIATGDCSDLVAAIVAATRAPVVVVPSMNDAMYRSPAVQANLATLRAHGRYVVHPALGVEVAHRPHARAAMLGAAPPVGAVLDIVRHLLRDVAPRTRLPEGAADWEQLWSTMPAAQLPWHADALEAPLAEALDAYMAGRRPLPGAEPSASRRAAPRLLDLGGDGVVAVAEVRSGPAPRPLDLGTGDDRVAVAEVRSPAPRLLDLGTGDGLIAVAAAQRGFEVTAVDVAPSALGRARERAEAAGASTIVFVLDDVTASQLAARRAVFDIAVDRGLLHSLSLARRADYAAAVTALLAVGGVLLLVAHQPAGEPGTHPVTTDELRALLPAFDLVRATPMTLAGAPAQLFELARRR